MRRHRTLAAAAVALVLGGGALLVPLASATDDVPAEVTEAAWWSRRPGAAEKPPGEFEVGTALVGDLSVAALRIQIPSGWTVTTARLVLTESSAAGSEAAALEVCAGPATWVSANPGAWDERPEPDCTAAVELDRQAAGGRWVGDVGTLLSGAGDDVALMVLPAEGEGGLPLAGFQLEFAGATVVATGQQGAGGGDDVVDWRTGGDDDTGGDFAAPADGGAPGGSTAPGPPLAPAPASPGPDATGPPVDEPVDDGEDGDDVAAALPTGEATGLGSGPVASQRAADRPWHRLLLLLPLSALAGAGVAAGRSQLRENPPALLRRLTG